jgi:hypothetical protein
LPLAHFQSGSQGFFVTGCQDLWANHFSPFLQRVMAHELSKGSRSPSDFAHKRAGAATRGAELQPMVTNKTKRRMRDEEPYKEECQKVKATSSNEELP